MRMTPLQMVERIRQLEETVKRLKTTLERSDNYAQFEKDQDTITELKTKIKKLEREQEAKENKYCERFSENNRVINALRIENAKRRGLVSDGTL